MFVIYDKTTGVEIGRVESFTVALRCVSVFNHFEDTDIYTLRKEN